MWWGEQVVDIAIKLQILYRFCSGAMILPYVAQRTVLSTAGYSLKICYHTGVQIPILNVSNTPHHIISFVRHVVTDGRKLESRKLE